MKLVNQILTFTIASAVAAQVKEGFDCVKGVDTCKSNSGAVGQCCNLVTYGIKDQETKKYTALQTIKHTLCVDTSAELVTDETGGTG